VKKVNIEYSLVTTNRNESGEKYW